MFVGLVLVATIVGFAENNITEHVSAVDNAIYGAVPIATTATVTTTTNSNDGGGAMMLASVRRTRNTAKGRTKVGTKAAATPRIRPPLRTGVR